MSDRENHFLTCGNCSILVYIQNIYSIFLIHTSSSTFHISITIAFAIFLLGGEIDDQETYFVGKTRPIIFPSKLSVHHHMA